MNGNRVLPDCASVLLRTAVDRNAERLWGQDPSTFALRVRWQLDIAHTDADRAVARASGLGYAGGAWFPDDRTFGVANRALLDLRLPYVTPGHSVALGLPWLRGKLTVPLYRVSKVDGALEMWTAGIQAVTTDGEHVGASSRAGVMPTRKQLLVLAGTLDPLAPPGILVAPDPVTAVAWRCALAGTDEPIPLVASVPTVSMTPDQAVQLAALARGGSVVLGTPASPDDPAAWSGEERVRQFRRTLKSPPACVNVEIQQIPAPEVPR